MAVRGSSLEKASILIFSLRSISEWSTISDGPNNLNIMNRKRRSRSIQRPTGPQMDFKQAIRICARYGVSFSLAFLEEVFGTTEGQEIFTQGVREDGLSRGLMLPKA